MATMRRTMAATRNSILQDPTCGEEEDEDIWQNCSEGTNFWQAFSSSFKVFPQSLLNVRNHPKTGLRYKLWVLFRASGSPQDFLNITQQAASRSESRSFPLACCWADLRPRGKAESLTTVLRRQSSERGRDSTPTSIQGGKSQTLQHQRSPGASVYPWG